MFLISEYKEEPCPAGEKSPSSQPSEEGDTCDNHTNNKNDNTTITTNWMKQPYQQCREYVVVPVVRTTSTLALKTTAATKFSIYETERSSVQYRSKNQWYYFGHKTIQQIVYDLFLPIGYPSSVRTGYIQYQLYDSIQGLCSYLRGVLCSAAVLHAVGVGNANATALGAAITWILKDGYAMIGGLYFSYTCAKYFDGHIKEFRLFADIMNDVGFLLDMCAPLVDRDKYLLYISTCSVLCKTMCGIAAGATKSNITQHFAIYGNMADLNAKESTQETAVSLLGMILGIWIAKYLHNNNKVDDDRFNKEATNYPGSNDTTNWIFFGH